MSAAVEFHAEIHEEDDLAEAALDRLTLVFGQVLPGEPAWANDAEEALQRLPLAQAADQGGVHLISAPGLPGRR